MNKKQVLKSIITDESYTCDYIPKMVYDRTAEFKLMLRELQNPEPDCKKIGLLFKRAYGETIKNYVAENKN